MLLKKAPDGQEQQLIPAGLRPIGAVHLHQGGGPQPRSQGELIPGGPVLDLLGGDLAIQQTGEKQLPQGGQALLIPAAEGLHIPALQLLPLQLSPQLHQDGGQLRGVDGL